MKISKTLCHPFYAANKGWVKEGELKAGDVPKLYDGKEVIIEKTEIEILTQAETTYNFEVADFHTYYVGNLSILCHNRCKLAKNMEKAGTKFKPDEDAHHLYPNHFRDKFEGMGITIDDAVNGIVMNKNTHRAGAYAYNKLWAEVIDSVNIKNAPQYMR